MNIIQIIPLPFYMLYPDGYQSRAGTVSKRWSWLTAQRLYSQLVLLRVVRRAGSRGRVGRGLIGPEPFRGFATTDQNNIDLILKENYTRALLTCFQKIEKRLNSKKCKLYIKDSVEMVERLE